MVTMCTLAGLILIYTKILLLSKGGFTQARGVGPISMWDGVPVKNFIPPVLHLQIGLGNDILRNLLYFIDSDMEKLSTGE